MFDEKEQLAKLFFRLEKHSRADNLQFQSHIYVKKWIPIIDDFLSGFFVIIFRLEKMRFIGKYAVAFRKTIKKSIFLFPIFLALWLAFVWSFQIQSNFGIEYFVNDSFRNSSIKTLTMLVGDFQTVQWESRAVTIHLFTCSLLSSHVSILFNNLFVAIAVGELSKVIKDSKIIHICLRIEYVIKTE